MALGNPGKIVGMMWDEKQKRWVFVEAAAGLGATPSPWPALGLVAVTATCVWLLLKP